MYSPGYIYVNVKVYQNFVLGKEANQFITPVALLCLLHVVSLTIYSYFRVSTDCLNFFGYNIDSSFFLNANVL